jgi:hypothetical protein
MEDPFPKDKLTILEFGSADGFKDKELESSFIKTRSIQRFLQDNHSIIVGPMGTGKSALFKLLKQKSPKMGNFKNKTVISIDELIPFQYIKQFASLLSSINEKQLYQFIWKFQITQKISESFTILSNFPQGKHEDEIHNFLKLIQSKEFDESVIGKLKGLLDNTELTLKTKISNTPIDVEMSISLNKKSEDTINIDRILKCCIEAVKVRNKNGFLVIIDKLDTFVAGEEYETQRKYIEALLEVEEDMSVQYPIIRHKIFLRSDLFARINFETLGRDKVNDNTLRMKWTHNELIYFIGTRIKNALEKEKIINAYDILATSPIIQDMYSQGLLKTIIRFSNWIPPFIKRKYLDLDKLNEERNASLKEEFMKLSITKIFPKMVLHRNKKCEEEEICIYDFLKTHFLNAHEEVSPRNILIFLKQVNDHAITYYDENSDQEAYVVTNNNIPEWKLYKKNFIYSAYLETVKDFTKNICKTEDKWSKYFATFLKKRGKKNIFDFHWIKTQTDLSDSETASFCSYLEYIGFVYVSENHPDVKKRKYKLPVMYMPSCKS